MDNRPRSRDKNVTGNGSGLYRRGSGLGSGPVGNSNHSSNRSSGGGRSGGTGRSPFVWIALVVILALGGGKGLFGSLFNSFLGSAGTEDNNNTPSISGTTSGNSSGWLTKANTGVLNASVAEGSRSKRTKILGNGQDVITIMVYMCGTDLESKHGMATSDLQEMMAASFGDNINLLVYTGGCKAWKNSTISNRVNQIYQIKNGKLHCLVADDGEKSMTSASTLSGFIQYCAKNYPANRNELILWDHGGGSISGFGYDEKNAKSGSLNLDGLNQALKSGGVYFDFIGYDACLMATLETALTMEAYADYLIASEETEPGVGWYYTNWLTALGKNTSMPTIELGKKIVDDFVDTCAQKCNGQKTTLSVIDLAELVHTVPQNLTQFASSMTDQIQKKDYKTVSNARYGTREFATSSKIDQVDLTHLALNIGNNEGKALANALLGAVKYNRTSGNMTNAYGISIYFPYQKVSKVDNAVATYQKIGMDEEYTDCIKAFAGLEVGGQISGGGSSSSSPMDSLLGSLMSNSQSSGGSSHVISNMLTNLVNNGISNVSGLNLSNIGFLTGNRALSNEEASAYLAENYFDASKLVWKTDNGVKKLSLSEEQWSLVQLLDMSMFYDDGSGYIDLGLDNVFQLDDKGNLIGSTDRTWLAINGQVVPYYHTDTTEDGDHYSINGYIPAKRNGEFVHILVTFDNQNPKGYIVGVVENYKDEETDTVAKAVEALCVGDVLDFVCDYYTYDGDYQDSYLLGEPMIVTEHMVISDVSLGEGKVKVAYRFMDIYHQYYWTPEI